MNKQVVPGSIPVNADIFLKFCIAVKENPVKEKSSEGENTSNKQWCHIYLYCCCLT